MKTQKRLTSIPFFLFSAMNMMINLSHAQDMSLETYIHDLSIRTNIYRADSSVWNGIVSGINDSNLRRFNCLAPTIYRGGLSSLDGDSLIDLTALNVWDDSTYIVQLKSKEDVQILLVQGIVVLCDKSLIQFANRMSKLSALKKMALPKGDGFCEKRAGTGIYYRITFKNNVPELSQFGTLNSRY